ncbi:NUDIX domain-containing protein [Paracoccus salsus]|uniref:NUDIX domain-containing protein n=1 Tax=Paracoccus salsus TaxID=2911061 RepID=UPI001F3F7E82|nr:NUDIX hydrolase [Paracoccus salsus]MCF3972971.1 NUDIX hydrolase [Paracoccus salsus]
MIPRFGHTPRRARRYRLRPGAYAVLIRDGRVLLTHQDAPDPEFQLPGGGIDPGEGAIGALHREVLEETGWTISGLCRIGAYRRFCYMPDYGMWAEKLCSVWTGRPVLRRAAPTEPGHSAHWLAASEAARRLADPGARAFLRDALAGRGRRI